MLWQMEFETEVSKSHSLFSPEDTSRVFLIFFCPGKKALNHLLQ